VVNHCRRRQEAATKELPRCFLLWGTGSLILFFLLHGCLFQKVTKGKLRPSTTWVYSALPSGSVRDSVRSGEGCWEPTSRLQWRNDAHQVGVGQAVHNEWPAAGSYERTVRDQARPLARRLAHRANPYIGSLGGRLAILSGSALWEAMKKRMRLAGNMGRRAAKVPQRSFPVLWER
jgi:hypothetical protein